MLYSLNEIYASGGQIPIMTLTITNNALSTMNFVLAFDDITLNGELYQASSFSVSIPERSDSGFTDLNFAICNVSGQAYSYVMRALNSQEPTYITMRQWSNDTKELMYELRLTVTGGEITDKQASFTASFCDMLNCEFPKLRYTSTNAPGLLYIA